MQTHEGMDVMIAVSEYMEGVCEDFFSPTQEEMEQVLDTMINVLASVLVGSGNKGVTRVNSVAALKFDIHDEVITALASPEDKDEEGLDD